MKNFNPNKNIIITLILVIIVVSVISLSAAKQESDGNSNVVQSTLNDTVSVIDKVVTAPVNWVIGGIDAIGDLFDTYSENQQLKTALDEYEAVVEKNKEYEKQLSDLQAQLDLNGTLSAYEKISATVISRSPDSWQDTLVVDGGAADGVEVNMAVMAKNGLIGRVIEVNASTSKVELLTSDNQTSNHFPVKIESKDGNSFGLLEGYDEENDLLILTQITGDFTISEGDQVKTSGLGGNSPADLIVGEVVSISNDSLGLEREILVKANADMYDIPVVTIIKRTVEAG